MTPSATPRARVEVLRRRLAAVVTGQVADVREAVGGLGRLQAALLVVGALVVGYGGVLMFQLLIEGTAPALGVGAWWLSGPLVVDLIAVPVVVASGVVIGRIVPSAWRRYVSGAAALSVQVTLVAFPFLTGLGRRPDNPSLLDRDYWSGYLVVVGLIWCGPLVVRLVGAIHRRSRQPRTGEGAAGRRRSHDA